MEAPALARVGAESDLRPHVRFTWEHSERELLSGLRILSELDARNLPWVTERVRSIGPVRADGECVLIPFYYDASDINQWLYRLTNRPVRVLNLAYEQMHPPLARDFVMPDGEFATEELHYCAWGNRFRSLLIEAGIDESKIHMTGHPRFDLYADKSVLRTRESLAQEYGLDANKPWLLFPCNFNFAYVSQAYIEATRRRGYRSTPEFIEGFAKARDAFIDMICQVAEVFPDHEIIARVHPAGFEKNTLYAQAGSRFPHLHAISNYDIAHWICQSEAVIVWNSTSSMEAMVAGVPVISYDTEGFGDRYDYDVNKILPTLTRTDDIIDLIRTLPNPKLNYDWECFEGWYQYRDGRNASRIVDAVEAVAQEPYGSEKGIGHYVGFNPWRRIRHAINSRVGSKVAKLRQPFSRSDLIEAMRTGDSSSLERMLK